MKSFIRELGPKLIRNGYPICAIHPGEKRPVGRAWSDNPLTLSDVATMPEAYGIGILCGQGETPLYALDIDSKEKELTDAVVKAIVTRFPKLDTPFHRVGRKPKLLLLYRGDRPRLGKMTSARFRKNPADKSEPTTQLEVLGFGQQFVAYGRYPTEPDEAPFNYEWPYEMLGASPAFTPVFELALITAEEAAECLTLFEKEAARLGYHCVSEQSARGSVSEGGEDFDVVKVPVYGLTLADAERVIRELKLDLGPGTNDSWVRLGMALHHQFNGSEEALALWDSLSLELGPEAYTEGECAKRWASFNDARGGSIVTFRTYLKLYRKTRGAYANRLDERGLTARYLLRYGDLTVRLAEFQDSWMFFDPNTCWWDRLRGEAFTRKYVSIVWEEDMLQEIAVASDVIPQGLSPKEQKKAKSPKQELVDFRDKCFATMSATTERVMRNLRADPTLALPSTAFDCDPRFVGVRNGVLDLDSREVIPNRPELRVFLRMGCDFDPSAKCPVWDQTVLQIFDDDPEVVVFFHRVMGAALRGRLKDEHLVLLRGLGANGKSLIVNTLAAVFGEYAQAISEETLLGMGSNGSGGGARADLAKLAGARFVYCSETTESNRFREATVKRMTGRDAVVCRAPYARSEISIQPSWRLMVVTNHPPRVVGDDDGIWRRMIDLECPRNFETDPKVKKDPFLEDKLRQELPGILNRLLEGLSDYESGGGEIRSPAKVLRSVAEYRDEQDDVKSWFERDVIYDGIKEHKLRFEDCFARFRAAMEKEGEMFRDYTFKKFRRRLLKLIPVGNRRRMCTGTSYYMDGYVFREADFEEDFL